MNVLIIGSGGREHALVWKVAQSPRLTKLYVAPGNAGTAEFNVPLPITAHSEVVNFAKEHEIDLVIIGPEAPLADGLGDSLRTGGLKVFGPSQAAAELESSKAFSKAFMARHDIPTARFATFTDYETAMDHLMNLNYPVVIKASGLAAGKGVILPADMAEAKAALSSIMLEHEFGAAGDEVIIEERISGEEVSLLCFSDGLTVKAMPPAQDHKRLLDGDKGPNTGGMGAYAPAPVCPPALAEEFTQTILQPTIDAMLAEGRPFVGVLYAGLMLTENGPSVLEFNCRFGDPETQVIIPLLETDLIDITEACAEGRLAETNIVWKSRATACVVTASEGYPGKYPTGRAITGLEAPLQDAVVFHAGTTTRAEQTVTSGGRVLAVTGWGENLATALEKAYAAVKQVGFEGMQYRNDIGWRATQADSLQQTGNG